MKTLILYFSTFFIIMFMAKKYYSRRCKTVVKLKVSGDRYIKIKEPYVFMIILLPTLVAGFRFYVGVDYGAYENIFILIKSGQSLNFEPAYMLLNKIIALLGGNFTCVSIISAFLIYYFYTLGIVKICEGKEVYLVVWLYFISLFAFSLNTVRQALAISIITYAISLLLKNEYKKYIFWVIVATLFHSSSIICMIFLIFKYDIFKRKKTIFFLGILCVCVLLFSSSSLITTITNIIPLFERYTEHEATSNYIFWKNFVVAIPYYIVVVSYNKLKKKNKDNVFFLNLVIFEMVLMILAVRFRWAFRMMNYMNIGKFVLVPRYIELFENKKIRQLLILVYILYSIILFIYGTYYENLNGIFPYRTKWGGL